MQILHCGSLDIKTGGPALSTYLTMSGLNALNISTAMLMSPLNIDGKLIGEDIKLYYTYNLWNKRLGYMPSLAETIRRCGEYDLYHIQGLWKYLGHGVANYANKTGKPYVMTLRGMLYPQALEKSSMIKNISMFLYQKQDLEKATCIHVTCSEEMEHYRKLGFRNPVAIIPNPIQVPGTEDAVCVPDKFCIGYLGRVHPRKRIERILDAVFTLQREDVEILIIGDGDTSYMTFLHQEVKRLQIPNVFFTGFLSGEDKRIALKKISYLLVPSDFENFGNIITEALSLGIPVIASKGTPWEELNTHRCGWWVDNDVPTLAKTLQEALLVSEEERIGMGERGRKLIRENYSTEIVAEKMKRLYEWILNGGEKPEFVYLK